MTSAVGGGSPKSRQKEQNQLIFDSDKGGGGQTRGKCPYRLASPKLISVTRVPLVEPINSYYMVIFPKLSSVIAI